MRELPQRKPAHPNTYLIGNLVLVFLSWLLIGSLIWYLLPIGWLFRLLLVVVALFVVAYVEHQCCTGLIGSLVERLFPDEETTAQYRRNSELLEKVRRRGHW